MPNPIDIAILTVQRTQDYLPQTLASLFASGPDIWNATPIQLFVGNQEEDYLSPLRQHPSLEVQSLPAEDWKRMAAWKVHRRLTFNLWRALAFASDASLGRCICEDDIVVKDGFYTKMVQAVEETFEREGSRFVLALYSHFDYASASQRQRGKFYCSYDASQHYGNCCLFVSADLLADLAEHLRVLGVEQDRAPADILLGQICEDMWQQNRGGMYQTVVSLAQHQGIISNGTSEQYSRSPTFERPWPAQEEENAMVRPESEFTGSWNPDCPHPEHWTAPDVHATECEVTELVAAWVRALQPELVVETGSYHGHTTLAIAQAMQRNGHGRLVSLEIDAQLADLVRQRVAAYPHAEIHCTDSLQWTPPSPIGFAWFDSAVPNRELEFKRYFPWLRGAIVGFHDTGRHHHVVRTAVEKLAQEGLLTPIFLNTPRGVAFAQVTR